ncbi:LADA_0G06612g1_1 [Lachancea dasiensis]|uniref:LADA_0G06612g1_1 n=1 Tax=Lachancea dasiensis TaxID=1072105 RepID=A0A1G4JT94_9SACH|nr:LADA_0G06612g1_1 [Lachancea dasiensis]
MLSNVGRLWASAGVTFFVLLFCGYTYYIVALIPSPSLPLIATQRVVNASQHDRWIFVGDVHGMFKEFQELMQQVDASRPNTKVVLLGDFIVKGPDSAKMIHYLRENANSTHCVLGNHEIDVMFAYLNKKGLRTNFAQDKGSRWDPLEFSTESYIPSRDQVSSQHGLLAQQLGQSNLAALASLCSAELQINLTPTGQTLVAVHAGLAPEYQEFDSLNIKSITTMKYMLPKDHSKTSKFKFDKARRWFKLWTRESAPEGVTVLYGHDAGRGLNLRHSTKGLDSACVSGGKLSALEYVFKGGRYHEFLHQVGCRQFG